MNETAQLSLASAPVVHFYMPLAGPRGRAKDTPLKYDFSQYVLSSASLFNSDCLAAVSKPALSPNSSPPTPQYPSPTRHLLTGLLGPSTLHSGYSSS